MPTEQEWDDWKAHPATLALHKILRQWQEDVKSQWAAGSFTDQSQFGTIILNAKAIGKCEAFDLVVELELDQILGELNDSSK